MPEFTRSRNPTTVVGVVLAMAHTAHTESSDKTWTVSRDGTVIARSSNVVMVHEHYNGTDAPPVPYIPVADVQVELSGPTGHSTSCPVKGTAGYYSPKLEEEAGAELHNSIWFYPEPLSPLEPIADHVAFYGDRYDITAE